jgi:cytochrome c peroxidase
MAGGEDNRSTSVGIKGQVGGRNAPTVWNSAFQSVMFWDGRAASLEEQAKGPLVNPIEMGMPSHDAVIEVIKKIPGYVSSFEKVFGKNSLNIDNVAKAIAAYERTLVTYNSPFDKFISGQKNAMTDLQIKGFKKFQEVGCIACHNGVNFSGPSLPQGTGFYQKFPTYADNEYNKKYNFTADKGRYEVTKKPEDMHMFRVPTLRNIALTAPYFHNGKVKTLDEAVKVMAKTQLNRDLSDEDVKAIASFLNALTGEKPKQTMPELPETAGTTVIQE